MPKIFISYRHSDASDVTTHIYECLEQQFGSDDVFMDVDTIPPGVDFREHLHDAVSRCSVVLAVIGRDWLDCRDDEGNRRLDDPSDFVRIELESALQRKIPVIPVLVRGAPMPRAAELPQSLRDLVFRNAVHVRPAPDFRRDVDRLIRALEKLSAQPEPGVFVPQPVQLWRHETTEDEYYVPPARALKSLHEHAIDVKTRVMTITGFGGIGKTALVGHWIKDSASSSLRRFRGVFYWSFRVDHNVESFLDALIQFATDQLGYRCPGESLNPFEESVKLLRTKPLLVVLDGLEVHQQGTCECGRLFGFADPKNPDLHTFVDYSGTSVSHELQDPRLRKLLIAACEASTHKSLILITSRFGVTEISSYLGRGVEQLGQSRLRLRDDEGAHLLEIYGLPVLGREQRRDISARCDGHPLGLRLLVATAKRSDDGCPCLPVKIGVDGDFDADETLDLQLRQLVRFYDRQLSSVQKALLRIVSLFRVPVTRTLIATLAQRIPRFNRLLGRISEENLLLELQTLVDEGVLLQNEVGENESGYSCHPILQRYFREARQWMANPAGTVQDPTELADVPAEGKDKIALLLGIIELFIEAGDFARADEAFRLHLDDGRLFLQEGELESGRVCVLEFVRDDQQQRRCETQLSETRLVYYLRMAGLFELLLGNTEDAGRYHAAAADRTTTQETLQVLLNHSLIWTLTGFPGKGENVARVAAGLARDRSDDRGLQNSLCCLAHALSVQGKTAEAEATFCEASLIPDPGGAASETLTGPDLILWVLHLLRVGHTMRARRLIEQELFGQSQCRKLTATDPEHLTRCQWALACIELAENKPAEALARLVEVEKEARKHRSLLMLPLILERKAEALWKMQQWKAAAEGCEEGLYLAASRRMVWIHVQAMILSARIRLSWALAETDQDSAEREWHIANVLEDADRALSLAQQHKYPWLRRDALHLRDDAEEA